MHIVLNSSLLLTTFCADGSGYIDSPDELKQVCINICFSIGIMTGLDILIAELDSVGEIEWDLHETVRWFLTTFEFVDQRGTGGAVAITGVKGRGT